MIHTLRFLILKHWMFTAFLHQSYQNNSVNCYLFWIDSSWSFLGLLVTVAQIGLRNNPSKDMHKRLLHINRRELLHNNRKNINLNCENFFETSEASWLWFCFVLVFCPFFHPQVLKTGYLLGLQVYKRVSHMFLL